VNGGRRAVVLTDVLNPCWIWKGADLSGVSGLTADVAAAPFNFQLGYPLSTIPLGAPPNTDGALEVRLDSCAGPALAILPLTPAVGASGVFPLKAAFDPKGRPADGHVHDLCFVFQRPRLNPMWVLNAVQLEPAGA
jgi:hexosaminidase